MNRRDFVKSVTATVFGTSVAAQVAETLAAEPSRSGPFLLSSNGCGRATGYAETNKIVTVGEKTHVAWLDSVAEGFRVRVRTFDRRTGEWSPTYTVGDAYDNHGGPALTVDSRGYLHIVYYPHHHPFRHRCSKRPNDASEWGDEVQFGQFCTYPTLVVGPDDTLYLTCRESNRKRQPWVVNLYTMKPDGPWEGPTPIMQADTAGYSQFQGSLAWGPDHQTLHLSTRMYGGKPGRAHTVGYMRSLDFGKTWQGLDGKRIELPATSKTIGIIGDESDKARHSYRCGSVAVDAAGVPHVLYSDSAWAWIARLSPSGAWEKLPLRDHVIKTLPGWGVAMPGGMHVGSDGRLFVALSAEPPKPDGKPKSPGWGRPGTEVVRLESGDGGKSFSAALASKADPTCANWLPNVERPTGFNRVTRPSLIYTAGPPGKGNRDILSNRVYWVG